MSINDPQWGNSHRPEQDEPEKVPEKPDTGPAQNKPSPPPPEGPPDLEVLWQQLVHRVRCRVAALLGRERPASPAAAPVTVPATSAVTESTLGWKALSLQSWLIGVSLLVGAWLMSGFYMVDTNQRGVLSRFGSIVGTTEPGWQWRWPYPIESVRLVNVTGDRTLEVGVLAGSGPMLAPGAMLTADNNLIHLSYAVTYQVTDPVAYLSRVEAPSVLLSQLSEAMLRQAVARQPLLAWQGAANPSTAMVAQPMLASVVKNIQSALDPLQTGLLIKAIEIRDVRLPSPVAKAMQKAERDEQAQIRHFKDAQAASADALVKTRKLVSQLQLESAGYAQTLELEALRVAAPSQLPADAEARQTQVDQLVAGLRQQYPLLFETYAALLAKVQTGSDKTSSQKTDAPTAATGTGETGEGSRDWRNRDIMRSRDRIDRPGSGS